MSEHDALEKKIRDIARSKEWIQDPDRQVFLEYKPQKGVYQFHVYWIENWKPGNYGFRMRGSMEIFPGEDLSYLLDLARWDALCWHHEQGLYPDNPERRRLWLNTIPKKLITE